MNKIGLAIIFLSMLGTIPLVLVIYYSLNIQHDASTVVAIISVIVAVYSLLYSILENRENKSLSKRPAISIDYEKIDVCDCIFKKGVNFMGTIPRDVELEHLFVGGINTVVGHFPWELSLNNVGMGAAQSLSISINDEEIINNLNVDIRESLKGTLYLPDGFDIKEITILLEFSDIFGVEYFQKHIYRHGGKHVYGTVKKRHNLLLMLKK